MEQLTKTMVMIEPIELDRLEKKIDSIRDQLNGKGNPNGKRYVRNKELSQILGLSESSLQNMRISGALPYRKIEGTILYDLNEVYEVIEKRAFNTKSYRK